VPTIESIAPNLLVQDVGRAVDWYVRVLGFRVAFQAVDYAGVTLGPATIVLARGASTRAGNGACHLRLSSGVDEYTAQIQTAGQSLAAAPQDRPEYGIREAAVCDPDGNVIYIGRDL
jgi:catechol 2,3-dioxygenase-like lactoylglutathione lyase family enzyme